MKNIKFNHHEASGGTGNSNLAPKPDAAPSIRVLQTWTQHREILLRNKLRLF